MSRAFRRGLGLAVALAATAALVALSRAPYDTGEGADALLRLSWSGRPQRIERCRELSDEELARRPAHMRRRLECEGRAARYVVRVAVDGRTASLDTVTGSGLRGDRSIYMLREVRVEPGSRAIAVEIDRVEEIENGGERPEALPPRLELALEKWLAPGAVALVTYDASARRLVLVERAPHRLNLP